MSERVLYLQPFPCPSFHCPPKHGVGDPCGNWNVDRGHVPKQILQVLIGDVVHMMAAGPQ